MPATACSAPIRASTCPTSNSPAPSSRKRWEAGEARSKDFRHCLAASRIARPPERRRDPKTGRVPAVRNTVDLTTATYSNAVGAALLKGQWRDPEFDPAKPAVYYARALEVPTPRWTTLLAAARHLPLPQGVPAT